MPRAARPSAKWSGLPLPGLSPPLEVAFDFDCNNTGPAPGVPAVNALAPTSRPRRIPRAGTIRSDVRDCGYAGVTVVDDDRYRGTADRAARFVPVRGEYLAGVLCAPARQSDRHPGRNGRRGQRQVKLSHAILARRVTPSLTRQKGWS